MPRPTAIRPRRFRPPPFAFDAAVAVAVLAAHTAPFLFTTRVADPVAGWTWWQYLPVPAMAVALLWRRRAPLPVLLAVLALQICYAAPDPDTAPQEVPYAVLVAAYSTAALCGPRARVWAVAVLAVLGSVQALGLVLDTTSGETATRGLILVVTAWILGRLTAGRQALAERLRAEKADEAKRAVARERTMIARDTHDILGHAISLIVVQAEAGAVVVHTAPDRAETALRAIAESGRGAMTQVRGLLGLWEGRERADAERPSIPGISDLVEGTGRTGRRVGLTVTGAPGALAADAEVAAYRIVQEALTNVVKHAGPADVEVRLDWAADGLTVSVTDDGNGTGTNGGGGRGLIGIRERARACGGTASFARGRDGRGFAVEARLPGRAL
ncbi:sensor histidine kinase [Phytomonospora endophytica]|uniref:histidine kinase n=1 Tax=Phytomonospora endophytica TaxID=714109 RepID=A0A841FSN1_9ACTN|nr:histidine kinase [Phytomonospora endophytica]MBB6038814.1 signal transduction histidine kinase [Phytomonospora endophytica]GIG68390.1 two-component sensor histidine kinase [Phytomonospora endophytica]